MISNQYIYIYMIFSSKYFPISIFIENHYKYAVLFHIKICNNVFLKMEI